MYKDVLPRMRSAKLDAGPDYAEPLFGFLGFTHTWAKSLKGGERGQAASGLAIWHSASATTAPLCG
jgi:hypothetical protein